MITPLILIGFICSCTSEYVHVQTQEDYLVNGNVNLGTNSIIQVNL